MKLGEYKIVFVVVGLVGVLLLASPALSEFIRVPAGEQFSELYVLGPDHLAENYPYNVVVGQNYSVYLGVGNQLGSSAYYVLYVKFLNGTDLLPNATTMTPSPASALYEYSFSLPDSKNWEGPLTFSVSNATVSTNQALIETLMINGFKFNVNKLVAWDSNSTTFSYLMVFELWLYNMASNSVQYNNRFVDLQLNLTETP